MIEKCPYCQSGLIERIEHGDYPGDFDYWCTTPDCFFNQDAQDRADERWNEYLNDTWEDEHGERHYY